MPRETQWVFAEALPDLLTRLTRHSSRSWHSLRCEHTNHLLYNVPDPFSSELVNKLTNGDTLIVKEVSRLGRRTSEVTSLIDDLKLRGIHLIIDNLGGVDVTSPAGKMIVDVMASLAEMERETMLERQRIGIERAKAEGKFKGKQQSTKTIKACQSAIKDIENGLSKEKAAKANGVGIATLYRFIKAA